MDSTELNQNGDCIEDISAEQLLSLDTSDAYDEFGDPEVPSRVGDQYQVKIPPLVTKIDYFVNTKNPSGAGKKFLMGLAIPIMWVNKEVENMKREKLDYFSHSNDAIDENGFSEFKSLSGAPFGSKNEKLKVNGESSNAMSDYCYCLVPGSCGDSWSDIDKASFLLGLYIFEKNFIQVKRFIGSKKMGDMLSFYYGKFYRSDEYERWSACRKMRSKRCVYGQTIFSGLRQPELLSRMLPRVSEECRKALLEVSKTFEAGKISLEDYVSSLKATVGMKILIEAVGIGKGKQDLTGITVELSKSNQVLHTRSEIPIGKACSSLTTREIIKFLTGDYRISKARANDLFWEAVWPLLLARGWHSEQPTNYAASSKHSLVFLMPGIKKFSRRRLTRGTHYFDSVTDVLSKVASEPSLLELEITEDGSTNETELEQDDSPERPRHCYLQPRTPSRNIDMMMKFTVVDTSLGDGKLSKVRELRNLPIEISKISYPDENSDQDSFEVLTDESNCAYTMCSDRKDLEIKDLGNGILMNGSNSSKVIVKNSKNRKKLYKDEQTKKAVKCHLSRGLKKDYLDRFAPAAKRQRKLSACTMELEFNENVPSQARPQHQDKLSSSSSSKGSPIESIKRGHNKHHHPAEHLDEKPQSRRFFDLNLPQVAQDLETGASVMELTKGQDGQTSKVDENSRAPKTSLGVADLEQQPNVNGRRQGTRNRPPTLRALEALANGFLTTNRGQKSKNAKYTSRPSRRASTGVGVTEFRKNNEPTRKEGGYGVCDGGNGELLLKFRVLSKGSGNQVSGP